MTSGIVSLILVASKPELVTLLIIGSASFSILGLVYSLTVLIFMSLTIGLITIILQELLHGIEWLTRILSIHWAPKSRRLFGAWLTTIGLWSMIALQIQ